jgi:hypothetical protein
MKYRILSDLERESFRDEFIHYLSSNTITADDWEKIQNESPDKAQQLFERFSDIVFQKVYEKMKYLEVFGCDYAAFYNIENDITHVYIIRFEPKEDESNYSALETKQILMGELPIAFSINQYKKANDLERELIVHDLMDKGASSSAGEIYLQIFAQTQA